jgi:NADPH:quinone reductase-like Zn-dependent oxidoreductase
MSHPVTGPLGAMMSSTMRGWTFTARGPPSAVLRLRSDLPRPTPNQLDANEVLVKVSHVAVFQGFAALMNIIPHVNSNLWIPCSDFSGVIEAVGHNVHSLRPGDAVFGSPDPKALMRWGSKYNGMLVDYAILPANQVVKRPDNISFESAAGLAGNGCTALQFCAKTGIKKGDSVLVTGASGGLGSIVLQVVRDIVGTEGRIVAVCSGANAELVKGLGADEVSAFGWPGSFHVGLLVRCNNAYVSTGGRLQGPPPTLQVSI